MNWYRRAQSITEPWTVTLKEFADYHNTGFIPSHAYENYKTVEDISWLGPKSKYPILHSAKQFGDKTIEFRMDGEKLKYVAHDADGNILRDERGLATYDTDEQIADAGRPTHDTTIVAFDGDIPVGWASDEWGTDGIWVVEDYQRLGIGVYLLLELR